MTDAPGPWKYSSLKSYVLPLSSEMVPEFGVLPCRVQLLMINWPLTHSRTPSSDCVLNVWLPDAFGWIQPDHRTEKFVLPNPGPGAALPQFEKLICPSVRLNFRSRKSVVAKYSP